MFRRKQNKNKIKRNKTTQFKDRLINTFLISPWIDSGTALGCYQQQDEILSYLITGKVCLVHNVLPCLTQQRN